MSSQINKRTLGLNNMIVSDDINTIEKMLTQEDEIINETIIDTSETTSIKEIEKEVNDLNTSLCVVNGSVEKNKNEIDKIKTDVSLIEQDMSKLSIDIETTNKKIDEYIKLNKNTNKEDIKELQDDIVNLKKELEDINLSLCTFRGENKNTTQDIEENISRIENDLKKKGEEIENIQINIKIFGENLNKKFNEEITNLRTDVFESNKNIKEDIEDLDITLCGIRHNVETNTKEIEKISSGLIDIPVQIQGLVKEEVKTESVKVEETLSKKIEETEKIILSSIDETEERLGIEIDNVRNDLENLNVESEIYYGNEDPFNDTNIEFPQDKLWITKQGAVGGQGENDPIIQNIYGILYDLTQKINKCNTIIEQGVIAGDSSIGGRTQMMKNSSTTAIHPITGQTEDTDYIEPEKVTYTVPNIAIKTDTLSNFQQNVNNLINGELIWVLPDNEEDEHPGLYIFLNNKGFMPVVTGTSGDINTDIMTDIQLKEAMERIYLNHLGLEDGYGNKYTININENGNMIVTDNNIYAVKADDFKIENNQTGKDYGRSYISDFLRINSVFFGGEKTTINSNAAATHNFVELANATQRSISLNGIYLFYIPYVGDTDGWRVLPLKGTIHPGNTFTIRGAQCSIPSNTCVNVDSYDMEWYYNGKLIEFSNNGGTFYLAASKEKGKIYNVYSNNIDKWMDMTINNEIPTSITDTNILSTTLNPYNGDDANIPEGYIDLMGVQVDGGNLVFAETNPIVIPKTTTLNKCIFFREYGLDPGTSTLSAYAERNTTTFWTYANMEIETTNKNPYYTSLIKEKLSPGSSQNKKNFFDKRSTFISEMPNCVNITFGKQATDTGNSDAVRCFNWVSIGYYDEYIEYRVKGSEEWIRKYSISKNNYQTEYAEDAVVNQYIEVYNRYRWLTSNLTPVTTHKVIIRKLSEGEYEYRVGRKNDPKYYSEIYTFIVKSDNEISSNGFKFIQTTDQQGFSFDEYQAWTKSAYAISEKEKNNYDFLINTGDMTQSGNRESEWIDYYSGKKHFNNIEEMPCIGNNDLCAENLFTVNGGGKPNKISSRSIWLFYNFDLDENNSTYFKYQPGESIDKSLIGSEALPYVDGNDFIEYFMPSLYSYNYGNYHFIVLNSEFMTNDNTYTLYYNLPNSINSFRANVYYNQYKWLEKDYKSYKENKKLIVYCHEIPFCIVNKDGDGNAQERSQTNGSKLNRDFSIGKDNALREDDTTDYSGGFSYSQFFQENNIKLCLGGHKHSYSLSYPTAEKITTDSEGKRSVESNDPWIDNGSSNDYTGGYTTYLMCQATGYKLKSNNDIPGNNIKWLQVYYPTILDGNNVWVLNPDQEYPMYSLIECTNSNIKCKSLKVDGVYEHPSGGSTIPFNINAQKDTTIQNILSSDKYQNNEYTITL